MYSKTLKTLGCVVPLVLGALGIVQADQVQITSPLPLPVSLWFSLEGGLPAGDTHYIQNTLSPTVSTQTFSVQIANVTGSETASYLTPNMCVQTNAADQFTSVACGGGTSSLGWSSGTATTSVVVSSPIGNIVADSTTILSTLVGTTSIYFTLNASSVTLQGPIVSSITQSGATAGSYTNTNLTVNAQGIVTSASNGTSGGGGGIVSPGTFTWVNNNGISLSTITASTGTFEEEIITQNGVGNPGIYPNFPLQIFASTNTFFQPMVQNFSSGTSANAGYSVTSNLGGPTSYYLYLGMTSSNFNEFGYNIVPTSTSFVYSSDSNMEIGAGINGTQGDIVFGTDLPITSDEDMRIAFNGAVIVKTSMSVENINGNGGLLVQGPTILQSTMSEVDTSTKSLLMFYASTAPSTNWGPNTTGMYLTTSGVMGMNYTTPSLTANNIALDLGGGIQFTLAGSNNILGASGQNMVIIPGGQGLLRASNWTFRNGAATPDGSLVDVVGNMSVGGYGNAVTAPANGIIVTGKVGISTGAPQAQLEVNGSVQVDSGVVIVSSNNISYLLQISTTSTTYQLAVTTNSHVAVGSMTALIPTLSGCGTGPEITGTDHAGFIIPGSTASGCTLTFAGPYKHRPVCLVTEETFSLTNALSYTVSTTALTISETSLTSTLDYSCVGVGE